MSHKVFVDLKRSIEIQSKDLEVVIEQGETKLGTLRISAGSLDWLPPNNYVNSFELKWEDVAEMFKEHGSPKRKRRTPTRRRKEQA